MTIFDCLHYYSTILYLFTIVRGRRRSPTRRPICTARIPLLDVAEFNSRIADFEYLTHEQPVFMEPTLI